jgi:hypothetical protein
MAEKHSPTAALVLKQFPEKVRFGPKPDGFEFTGHFTEWMEKEMGYY